MTPTRPADCVATVEQLRSLTPDVSELVLNLETPDIFGFKPGQFVNLYVPRDEGKPLIRAYSLATSPATPRKLTICFDSEVSGPGVDYLRSLKPGDQVRFKGPLGIFVLKEPSSRPVLIVTHISAAGMCRHLAEAALLQAPDRPVTLLIEVKDEHHLFYHKELLELSRQQSRFQHVFTCPQASAGWQGPRRTLLEETLRRIPESKEIDVYICGLGNMVATLKDALKEAGVPATQIVAEKWSKVESEE